MDAVCLGILVADVFSSPVDTIPEAGELRLADRFLLNAGGCAVNTGACLRRLGKSVKVLGKVGRDLFGDFVLQDLERLDIDASAITRSSTHPTSGTFILNVKGQDRRYIHVVGANGDYSGADIVPDALDGARVLYVGGYLAMPAFSGSDLAALFREAKARSLRTVLDVIIPAGRQVPADAIKEAMQYTDVFVPNQDEARCLTGAATPFGQAEYLSRLNPDC
ncbi:MAG: carbohydrate kinase family protein, partial [Acidobacteria bacterium]|nr:carbohydrate kinase family protein [Acidobacteriota bacterium]